eukprot:scaffold38205_cov25-Phaeocystis_antarctica.AAC.1
MPAEREKGQLAAGGAGRKICAHRHHRPRALLRAARRHRGLGQRVRACGYARPLSHTSCSRYIDPGRPPAADGCALICSFTGPLYFLLIFLIS